MSVDRHLVSSKLTGTVFIISNTNQLNRLKNKVDAVSSQIKNSLEDFDVIEGDLNLNIHNLDTDEINICFEFTLNEKGSRQNTNDEIRDKFEQMVNDLLVQSGITVKRIEHQWL